MRKLFSSTPNKRWLSLWAVALFCIANPQLVQANICNLLFQYLGDGPIVPVEFTFRDQWGETLASQLSHYPAYTQAYTKGDAPKTGELLYSQAISRKTDTHLILEKLGFEFHPESNGVGKISIPTLRDLIEKYDSLLRRNVDENFLSPSETLRPGLAYEKDGKTHFASLLELPEGAVPIRVFSRPDLFFKMINDGYFPMETHISLGLHELNHIVGLLDNPRFMSRVKQFAVKRPVSGRDLRVRLFFLFEGLSLVPDNRRDQLKEILSEPFQKIQQYRTITTEEVFTLWRKFDASQTLNRALQLVRGYSKVVRHYGALGRDLGIVGVSFDGETSDTLPILFNNVIREISSVQSLVSATSPDRVASRLAALQQSLARLEVALWESSNITVDQVFDELAQPIPSKSSRVYEMFVLSGLSVYFQNPLGGEKPVRGLMHYSITGEIDNAPTDRFTNFGGR